MNKIFVFFTALFAVFIAQAGLFDRAEFLRADEAFQFSFQQQGNKLITQWHIADGYYLYRKEIHFNEQNIALKNTRYPQGEIYQDEFFGDVEIYRHQLEITADLSDIQENATVTVSYQGCTKGLCYPPETQTILIDKITPNSTALSGENRILNEQDQLAQNLSGSKFAILGFFLLGIGLAFTPCVLPMLPLLSAVVIGQGERPSTLRAFLLSFSYVQGMALTYTLLGLAVVAIGLPFQVALQMPVVLLVLVGLFAVLSASMFGLFELRLPSRWQNKLHQWSQHQQAGAYGGVFVMGMLAGLVASPCTSAPLSGALLYVAQSGDLVTGGVTLYLLALGMGLPLMLITLFGNRILPKSGAWLLTIKQLFGFVMLLLPVILLARVFPQWETLFWGIWFIAFCCWVASKQFWVGFIFALLVFFTLSHFIPNLTLKSAVENHSVSAPQFVNISSYGELQQALADNPRQLAMLDLYADWCVACKEFDAKTFSDPAIKKAFESVLLLRVDMTKNTPENKLLIDKLQVLGLPSILFFDRNGLEIKGSRVTGFMDAQAFSYRLNELQK